jgi:hypothetical protein
MCNNLAYNHELGDTEVRNNRLFHEVSAQVLNDFCKMLNVSLLVLHPVPPLCDYKIWISTERGAKVKHFLCLMVELNTMEEEFRIHRMEERKLASYFAMQCEMKREHEKEKQGEERARKHEKACRVKEAYARGGKKALMKGKWPRLTQD